MMPAQLKTWLAFGSGIGIEISGPRDAESLRASAVRVRPTGARVIGKLEIENFAHQPAGVWGTEFSNFARRAVLPGAGLCIFLRMMAIYRGWNLPSALVPELDGDP